MKIFNAEKPYVLNVGVPLTSLPTAERKPEKAAKKKKSPPKGVNKTGVYLIRFGMAVNIFCRWNKSGKRKLNHRSIRAIFYVSLGFRPVHEYSQQIHVEQCSAPPTTYPMPGTKLPVQYQQQPYHNPFNEVQ